MDLKNTKAMEVSSTEKQLPRTEPLHTIVKVSAGLKSSYQSGLEAETFVALYYQKKGFRLLRQRWQTPFAEVDLIFERSHQPNKLLLVEVKKRKSEAFRHVALSASQRLRLIRVVIWLSELGYQVESHLVFVGKSNEIEIHTEIFG